MPKVSVIIPVYDRIAWASEAIQSVLTQTLQNYEIIVINDGSKENFREILNFKDNRIQYFEHKKNRGPSAARNTGIAVSKGDYIAFLDSDDLWKPTKLEAQTQIMDVNPHIILSHTSYDRIDVDCNFLETMSSGKFSGWVYPQILISCQIATPTVMLRRKNVLNMKFEESINISEDIIFWAEVSRFSEILGINQPLTKVRIHGSNAALDKRIQISGYLNIISHSIQNQADLSDPLIIKATNEILLRISLHHYSLGDYFAGFEAPFMILKIIPQGVEKWLQLMKNLFRVTYLLILKIITKFPGLFQRQKNF